MTIFETKLYDVNTDSLPRILSSQSVQSADISFSLMKFSHKPSAMQIDFDSLFICARLLTLMLVHSPMCLFRILANFVGSSFADRNSPIVFPSSCVMVDALTTFGKVAEFIKLPLLQFLLKCTENVHFLRVLRDF